jgi:glycyl-tRNA synthetase beta chain
MIGQLLASAEGITHAQALFEHLKPRSVQDTLPADKLSGNLAIADKLDTLVGFFHIQCQPTGDKDPFGLRRQALGVLKILLHHQDKLTPSLWLDACLNAYSLQNDTLKTTLWAFLMERLKHDQPNPHHWACIDWSYDVPLYLSMKKLSALETLLTHEQNDVIRLTYKRLKQILKGQSSAVAINPSLFEVEAEKVLHQTLQSVQKELGKAISEDDYDEAWQTIFSLIPAITKFFEDVMVMVDAQAIRDNRIALLFSLQATMLNLADLSQL